jgi:hypothetical protein
MVLRIPEGHVHVETGGHRPEGIWLDHPQRGLIRRDLLPRRFPEGDNTPDELIILGFTETGFWADNRSGGDILQTTDAYILPNPETRAP